MLNFSINSSLVQRVLFAFILSLSGSASASDTLKIFIWEDYLSQAVIDAWEAQSPIKIEQVLYDNEEERDRILTTPVAQNYDLVVTSDVAAKSFGDESRYTTLTAENFPNGRHIDSKWQKQCGSHSAPYFWGTLGIVYRSDKITSAPSSWNDLMVPSEVAKGHIGMVDDYTELLVPALRLLGYSMNTTNLQELKEAFSVLKQQHQYVATYDYVISYLQKENSEPLYMALAYSGDQYTLNTIAGKENLWRFSLPKEGTAIWTDCIAINQSSPKKAAALAFLNFINRPEIAAKNAEELAMSTPNESALGYVSKEYQQDQSLALSAELLAKNELYANLSRSDIILRQKIAHAVRKQNVTK